MTFGARSIDRAPDVFTGKSMDWLGSIMKWDGKLPKRRYAIFTDILRGEYMIVITGRDLDYAEKWGGFVRWVGGIKPAETRAVN
jgi:hypothetical protein